MGNTAPATEAQHVYPHTMRLQRFLARAGVASRRGSEDLMTAGRVTVNGQVATELGTKSTSTATISRSTACPSSSTRAPYT